MACICKLYEYAVFLIIVITSVALFGENFLRIQTLPVFNMTRVYNVPILERVDLYILALWFITMGCSMRAYIFAAYYSFQKVFKVKQTKTLHVSYFFLLIVLSRIPRDINQSFKALDIANLAGIGVSIYLALCLLLSFIRQEGVQAK